MARIQKTIRKLREYHEPVLLKSVLNGLRIKKNGKYIDATIGGAGHGEQIVLSGGRLLGLDIDPEAINAARKALECACPVSSQVTAAITPDNLKKDTPSWLLVRGNFKDIDIIAGENDFEKVNGILFDLGVSSHQLDEKKRGFSFNSDLLLDMRMSDSLSVTAADLLAALGKRELIILFEKYGDESYAGKIAREIVEKRKLKPIKTGKELSELIERVKPRGKSKTHPATKVFQALRIAVNSEYENLEEALPKAVKLLVPKGRLVIIGFHSGEDRIVKNFLKKQEALKSLKIITKKPIKPTAEEKTKNPRSRSAVLRIAEKI
jgi:16S rRNA (cytosine1402-N4)-methyltransferase